MRQNMSRTLTNLAAIAAVLALSGLLARLATAGGYGRVCAPKQKMRQVQKNQCISSIGFNGAQAECLTETWLLHQSACVVNQNGGDCEEFESHAAVSYFYEKRYLGLEKFCECTNLSGSCYSCVLLAGGASLIPGPHQALTALIATGCLAACSISGIDQFPACCYYECVESGVPLFYGSGTICPY